MYGGRWRSCGGGLPRFMKVLVKSTAVSRSAVTVRSVMPRSARWKKNQKLNLDLKVLNPKSLTCVG